MLEPEKDYYGFKTEWIDKETGLKRHFLLNFYPADNTLEMYDLDVNRIFLKRSLVKNVSLSDFYINNKVIIFGRLLIIADYADLRTKNKLCKRSERAMAIIKPLGMKHVGGIFNILFEHGFTILKCRMVNLTRGQAESLYQHMHEESYFPLLIENMIMGPLLAILLMNENAVCALQEAMGPTDPMEARKVSPKSIRALYGESTIVNVIHGTADDAELEKNMSLFFPDKFVPTLRTSHQYNNSTLCIIKPHAIKEGIHGDIMHAILDCNFKITGMEMFYLDMVNAAEFLEVYKGVVPDYTKMVAQLASGPCIVMEISTPDFHVETPQKFRAFVGPSDPDLARQLRPTTLRARFGKSKVENAIHCTDLPEDGLLEVEYFFKLLQI